MPEEQDIEVGDSEESAVDVAISDEKEQGKPVQQPLDLSQKEDIVVKEEEELDEYSDRVKNRIDQLTNRFREEERQKQTAVQFAENVRLENDSLKQRLGSLDRGYQEQFGGRVTSEFDSVKKNLKEAHESGDIDKVVETKSRWLIWLIKRVDWKRFKVKQPPKTPKPKPLTPKLLPSLLPSLLQYLLIQKPRNGLLIMIGLARMT